MLVITEITWIRLLSMSSPSSCFGQSLSSLGGCFGYSGTIAAREFMQPKIYCLQCTTNYVEEVHRLAHHRHRRRFLQNSNSKHLPQRKSMFPWVQLNK